MSVFTHPDALPAGPIDRTTDALLVIDVQNDFCPGGGLAVADGDAVVPVINRLMPHFDEVLLTQDWHPSGHHSFASTHPGRQAFETVTLAYGAQTLWPDHCIQGTHGAAFHRGLDTAAARAVIRKGFRPAIDSYSAFFENDRRTPTGLTGYLRERGLHLEVCPTSNVQTGAASSIAAHPIRALWRSGVSLSFHTDNRLISRTSASREAALLVIEAGLTWADLQRMSLLAAQVSFLPDHVKGPALSRIQDWSCPAA